MSLLNRPSDGLFNVAVVLARCVHALGPQPRDRLLALCAPPGAVGDPKMTRTTLNRWTELGLFEDPDAPTGGDDRDGRGARGGVRLAPGPGETLKEIAADDPGFVPALARAMRARALAPENNAEEIFWEAEQNRASDFTRAACWTLAQDVTGTRDVTGFAPVGHESVQTREVRQLAGLGLAEKDQRLLGNDVRWPGYKAWGAFLGFGVIGRHPAKVFWPDPTAAVADALPDLFGAGDELDQAAFLRGLADAVPVLDGGDYRKRVEAKLGGDWRPPPAGTVSTSLARALRRLEAAGALRLEDRADAPGKFALPGGRARAVSHVLLERPAPGGTR